MRNRVWPVGWRFLGTLRQEHWWQGELLDDSGQLQAKVSQGVLDFTGGAGFWSLAHLRQLDEQQWLMRNWQAEWQQAQENPVHLGLCRHALATVGPLMELAAGPGGGNLSPLLHLDPKRELLVNDLEPRLLQRWLDFLGEVLPDHQVTFAAFDITQMPLADASIGCISTVAGLGSIQGDPLLVLQECARALQPGGLLVAAELSLTEATAARLPAELRALWANSPWLLRRWPTMVQQAGLTIVSDETIRVPLTPESGLWQDATHFGVEPQAERHYLTIEKPCDGHPQIR